MFGRFVLLTQFLVLLACAPYEAQVSDSESADRSRLASVPKTQLVFEAFMFRPPSAEEIRLLNLYEVHFQKNGQSGLVQAAQQIVRGSPFQNEVKTVRSIQERLDRAYLVLFGRGVDPAGQAGWETVLARGDDLGFVAGLVGSSEFAERHLGETSSATDTPAQPPAPPSNPPPSTGSNDPLPAGGGCPVELPPLSKINVKIHNRPWAGRYIIDSTPIVCSVRGTRFENYCQDTMGDPARWCCPVRPEGDPYRSACEARIMGTDPSDGVAGPSWSVQGNGGGYKRENPYLFVFEGDVGAVVQACSNVSGVCGSVPITN